MIHGDNEPNEAYYNMRTKASSIKYHLQDWQAPTTVDPQLAWSRAPTTGTVLAFYMAPDEQEGKSRDCILPYALQASKATHVYCAIGDQPTPLGTRGNELQPTDSDFPNKASPRGNDRTGFGIVMNGDVDGEVGGWHVVWGACSLCGQSART